MPNHDDFRLAAYDGRYLAGYVSARRGGKFAAYDPQQKLIGVYASQLAASRALPCADPDVIPAAAGNRAGQRLRS